MIIKAFGITHDDTPYLDEDLINGDVDELVEQSIERKKHQFFIKLQHRKSR